VRVKLHSGAGRPPGAMEETDATAPFLLTGEPAVWLDTVFFPCAHVPLVTVIQFPLHLVGKNEIYCLKLLHHEREMCGTVGSGDRNIPAVERTQTLRTSYSILKTFGSSEAAD